MFGRVPTTLFNSSFVYRDTYRLVCDVWKYPQNANVFLQFFCNRKRFNCVWTKNGSMINCQIKIVDTVIIKSQINVIIDDFSPSPKVY